MSSLAAAQADGYYFPPEWSPDKGSLKKFTGSKGANQYEQRGVIRFELPYHSWCLKCERHIAKGVRFNAKKVQNGSYFTTKIWEFHMRCPSCSNNFIIRTDPKNTDYDYVEGIKKKEMEYDPTEIGLPDLPAESSSSAVTVDPLIALEKDKDDKRKANEQAKRMEDLIQLKKATEEDNYAANAALRARFRKEKQERKELDQRSVEKGMRFRLLEPDESDAMLAKAAAFSKARKHEGFRRDEKSKMAKIMSSSIFGDSYGGGLKDHHPTSKQASKALAQKELAVKRARLGLNPSNLAMVRQASEVEKGPGYHSGGPTLKRKGRM